MASNGRRGPVGGNAESGRSRSDGDEGIVERPEPSVLESSALVPAENMGEPPGRFSHEVVAETPYWYSGVHGERPDGFLLAGSPVLLVGDEEAADGSAQCRVVDSRGLSVAVRSEALRPLG